MLYKLEYTNCMYNLSHNFPFFYFIKVPYFSNKVYSTKNTDLVDQLIFIKQYLHSFLLVNKVKKYCSVKIHLAPDFNPQPETVSNNNIVK